MQLPFTHKIPPSNLFSYVIAFDYLEELEQYYIDYMNGIKNDIR